MGSIFAPATAIMSRLKFPQRFALITFLFLLPLGYALFAFIGTINNQINFSQKEAYGTTYLRPLAGLYHHINEHYLSSQVALQTNRPTTPALAANLPLVDADFAAVQTV